MSNRKMAFVVTVKAPEGVDREEMASYIMEAVQCWKGGMDPESAIFDMDRTKVTVKDNRTNTLYVD